MLKIAAVLALIASPALAWDDTESMTLANNLGTVLAGGAKCGYTFDNSAIIAFVQRNVPADDLGFASMLNTMTSGAGYALEQMPESAFLAQCAVIEQNARHFGFMH